MDNNKKDDAEDKWECWIDLKSISASQNEKNKDGEKNDSDTITLTIYDFGDGKEVTKLNVTKNTTMREIKKQLQQKYSLSDKRIDELYLSYLSANIFCYLNATVEQIFDENEIKEREVKAYTNGFNFNLKTSEKEIEIDNKSESNSKNNENKNDVKVNWKLIILGLLFFCGAVLARYLEASCFLIGGLVIAGMVFFGLSFVMWLKLKSCIGCIKIGVSKRTEEDRDPLSQSKSKSPVVSNGELPLDEQKI